MSGDTLDARAAGLAFGALGAVITSVWAVRNVLTVPSPDWQLYVIVVVAATVLTALVGVLAWSQVVARFDRWSIPVRGAIAGALTIWGALTLLVPVAALVHPEVPTDPLEAVGLGVFMATVGAVFVSAFFMPFGILTGYFLGRRQTDDPGPIPVVSWFG